MSLLEKRAGITHVTLSKVEKGDHTVSIGIYAKVMFVLGLIDNLYDFANPTICFSDFIHFVFRKLEIKNFKIFFHMNRV